MEILIQKKNIILDATTFTSGITCARMMDFRFNNDLIPIEGKSNSLECGSLVHHILEGYYKGKRDGLSNNEAASKGFDIGSIYIRGCPSCINGNCTSHENVLEWQGLKNTPEESTTKPKKTGWSHVLKVMEEYFDYYKNDSWVPIEIEHVKGKVIYEDDEIRVLWKAKYDLIIDTNAGFFPVDHKSMSYNYELSLLNNQFMGQAVLLNTRAMMINTIGFQTTLKPADKFKREIKNYTLDQLTEWSQEIVPYWAKIIAIYHESNIYPPNFSSCEKKFGRCDFYDVCSVDRSIRQQELRMKFVKGRKWDISNVD
jgi:hypothetical protein